MMNTTALLLIYLVQEVRTEYERVDFETHYETSDVDEKGNLFFFFLFLSERQVGTYELRLFAR